MIITLLRNALLWVQPKEQWSTNFQSLHIHTNLTNNSHQFISNLQLFLFKQRTFFYCWLVLLYTFHYEQKHSDVIGKENCRSDHQYINVLGGFSSMLSFYFYKQMLIYRILRKKFSKKFWRAWMQEEKNCPAFCPSRLWPQSAIQPSPSPVHTPILRKG